MDSPSERPPEIVSTSTEEDAAQSSQVQEDDNVPDVSISIKLKFINDDQKLVTASLKEALGDFKRSK